jgi:hypothetical protein
MGMVPDSGKGNAVFLGLNEMSGMGKAYPLYSKAKPLYHKEKKRQIIL